MNQNSQEIIVIVNKGAGTVKEYKGESLAEDIRQAFSKAHSNAKIMEISGDKIIAEIKNCINQKPKTIVAVGGDGTLSTVGGLLAGTDIALGIIPLGTFNLFAKDYKIPKDLNEAVKLIVAHKSRTIDICSVNDRKFIYCSVVGLYPEVLKLREKLGYSGKLHKFIVMMKAFSKLLWIFPIYKLKIKTAGTEKVVHTPIASISTQGMTLSMGRVTKSSIEDEGSLTLGIFKGRKGAKFFIVLVKELFGIQSSSDEVELIKENEVTILSRPKNLHLAIDGELEKMSSPLKFKIIPKGLKIIVPEEFAD